MKKLIAVLVALCLLCATVAALAEAETVSFDDMPMIVTAEDGVELTDADFEGDWIVDKVFLNQIYLTPEEVEANGLTIRPMRIEGGKVYTLPFEGEVLEELPSTEYTLKNDQLLFSDGEGLNAVFEKLEDGNVVLSIFIPGEGDVMNSVACFMVHPGAVSFADMPLVVSADEGVELTDADFEGDWNVDKVFLNETYLTPEEVEANGLLIRPIRVADGKVYNLPFEGEVLEELASTDYTLKSNQLLFSDGEGIEAVLEKLTDGNVVLYIFIPGEGDVMNSVAYFMVHPEA